MTTDTRFNTYRPIGDIRLAALGPEPVPQVNAATGRSNPVRRLLSSGGQSDTFPAEQERRTADLSEVDTSAGLYAINRALNSNVGRAGLVGATLANPALGLAGLALRNVTDPTSTVGGFLYGKDADAYAARAEPIGPPAARPLTLTPAEEAPKPEEEARTRPRELKIGDGGRSSGRSRNYGSDGDYATGRGVGSTRSSGSFSGYSGGTGRYSGRSDFGSRGGVGSTRDSGGGFSFEHGGAVPGHGPKLATLHGGEYVMTRDAVAGAGGGDPRVGRERMRRAMSRLETLAPMSES